MRRLFDHERLTVYQQIHEDGAAYGDAALAGEKE